LHRRRAPQGAHSGVRRRARHGVEDRDHSVARPQGTGLRAQAPRGHEPSRTALRVGQRRRARSGTTAVSVAVRPAGPQSGVGASRLGAQAGE
jgi:hypothetical protein